MNSVKLFCHFFVGSYDVFRKNFRLYLPSFGAFLLVDFLASFPWEGAGFESNSFSEIVTNAVLGVVSLGIIVNVVLIEKAKRLNEPKEELLYAFPTYLIHTLYASFIILFGFLLLVVPGVWAMIYVGLVPLASILSDEGKISYFTLSRSLAKKDPLLVLSYGVTSLLIELPSMLFDFIPDWRLKMGFNMLYAFIDAGLFIVLTLASVRLYYHLKDAPEKA